MLRHSSRTDGISVPNPNPPVRLKNRISHTKSRNGCYTCKRRRVKCDEERPICGACEVRGSQCTFPDPGSTKNRPRHSTPRGNPESSQDSIPGQHEHATPRSGHEFAISPLSFNLGRSGTPAYEGQSGGHLNMNDLKLLQHYILHTSKKMSLTPGRTLVWTSIFPDIAGTNEFFMHLLLALAGLDILSEGPEVSRSQQSLSEPPSRDLELAKLRLVIEHHQLGLQGFQEELCSTNDSNAEALMTGSMLIVAFAFASLRFGYMGSSQSSPSNPYNDADVTMGAQKPHTHWLRLVRGVGLITQKHWMAVKMGRCRALVQYQNANDDWKLCRSELNDLVPISLGSKISKFASGAGTAISDLRNLLHSLEVTAEQSPLSPEQSNIIKEQHHALTVFEEMHMRVLYAIRLQRIPSRPSSNLDVQAEIEEAAVTSWPHLVSQGFISSLETHDDFGVTDGVSFTILAHLYLVLAILEGTWYLGATFDTEIGNINTFISGLKDARLVKLMEWPMSVIENL
ncbi:unnamed protein product [Penicillium salamii]|nr:unnamed protein product [Penicillium salamii]CAG8113725.1 unnamed protein product [Penicillium salamii]CAG8364443.1 unnamed protein product [Penicillium salamii]